MPNKKRFNNKKSFKKGKSKNGPGVKSQDNVVNWGQQTSHISRVIGAYDRFGIVLAYKENGIHFSGAPNPSAQVFRANSLFDPNLTGTGHQPDFFDQYAAMYGVYVVTGTRAEVTVVNNSSTVPSNYVVTFTDQNNSANSVESLSENKYAIYGVIATSAGPCARKIHIPYISSAKLQGMKNVEEDPSNYTAVGGNPVDVTYLIIKLDAVDTVSNINVYVNVKIYYTVIFKELVSPVES